MKKKIVLSLPILLFVMIFLVNCDKDKCKKNCDIYNCNIKIYDKVDNITLLDTLVHVEIIQLNDTSIVLPFDLYNKIDCKFEKDTVTLNREYKVVTKNCISIITGNSVVQAYMLKANIMGDSIFFSRLLSPRPPSFHYSIVAKGVKL